ncbi:hypothetical protein IFM89_032804 [Coptis chinensis]|uniref:DNA 3'-5' helicase n=1 Tax=Coptis chinensis TaxID=261450 RepID=A0A835HRE4_9MAGN|nr:hypothetical protein IFM89_032804 [Coptis chinensis]
MKSDSDSEGSHISTTPPRNTPKPKPEPNNNSINNLRTASLLTLQSSYKPRVRFNPFHSVPIPIPIPKSNNKKHKKITHTKPKPKPKPNPKTEHALPMLPLHITHISNTNHNVSMENVPANFCSKSTFFSTLKRPYEIPEENVVTEKVVGSTSTSSVDVGNVGSGEKCKDNVKVVRKYNGSLIGGNVDSLAVKRVKVSNEGNFVRLNINGYGKSKFKNKFKRKYGGSGSGSSSLRSHWRSKKKLKVADDEEGGDGLCEEDGLVTENPKVKKLKEGVKFSLDLIEQAVLDVRNDASDENFRKLLKFSHGYDSFRDGQLEAIKQVVEGESTMLVLPTGAGKSLCYQLPAMVLEGITLVVLFVSPERFLNADFLSKIGSTPLISLVVVDEAHCLSEWSHNFRPSYLRLRASLLRATLNVQCILAMTATATTKTLRAVMSSLDIPPTNLVQKSQIRENLQLSVTLSGDRQVVLLVNERFGGFDEIISFRGNPEYHYLLMKPTYLANAFVITIYLQRLVFFLMVAALSYHSGIPAKDRSRTQELFCSNKIRVVVATVAFGMGLDKSDVGAVIHYSLPESLEEYVQEVGRAGRDSRLSFCHLFYDDSTYFKLRSLSYSDGVDEYAVNKFLAQVFSSTGTPGKICSLVKEFASRKFDMKEEVSSIYLIFSDAHSSNTLGVRGSAVFAPTTTAECYLHFMFLQGCQSDPTSKIVSWHSEVSWGLHTTPAVLSGMDIVVAEILKKSEMKQGAYVFDLPTVANNIGITTIELSNQLQNLKAKGEITYEVKDSAFCYRIVKNPRDFCSLTSQITRWLSEVESCKVMKLDEMFNAATFTTLMCDKTNGCSGTLHTHCLQSRISDYFSRDNTDSHGGYQNAMGRSSPFLRADIKVFLQSNSHAKFTPRAIARIMHGIPSPAYPSSVWSKTHFWGRYSKIDFPAVMEAASAELMSFAGKDLL